MMELHFRPPMTFGFDHPIEETGRILFATLLKHLDLGHEAMDVASSKDLSPSMLELGKKISQTKWRLIRQRQDQDKSYKEICSVIIEKCR